MKIVEKFSSLFKREVSKDKSFSHALYDANAFFEATINLWNPNDLINKVGGVKGFEMLAKDPEIYAAIDKRIAALIDTRLVLSGDNETLNKWFTEQLKPHETQLKKDFWWSQFNGYGVEQIIYNEDGSGEIVGFQKEDFWRFEPMRDLIHVKFTGYSSSIEDDILPYGKFVLTVNDGSQSKPTGNPIAEKVIAPWYMMCTSEDLWIDFAKRFANGYMHGKIADEDKAKKFKEDLERSGKSSFMVTDKETEINLIQPNRDSSLYLSMTELAAKRIQKVILGGTQTSEMEARGSSGSAGIHNDVRLEKTLADIQLVQDAINETILQIALVNEFIPDASYRDTLPKATLVYDPQFNLELATRDSTLSAAGVKFNKQYYIDNYGFKEEHFEVVDPAPAPSNSFFQKKRSFLTKDDVNTFLLSKGSKCCPHNLDSATRKENRIHDEVDEIVALVDRNAQSPIDVEMLIAAINSSENELDLNNKLLALFDNKNNQFADTMTEALYLASARGAMVGNPEVIK